MNILHYQLCYTSGLHHNLTILLPASLSNLQRIRRNFSGEDVTASKALVCRTPQARHAPPTQDDGHPMPPSAAISALVQPWTTRSKVGPMSPSVVQGRPFCGGLEWSKANFGRAGPGPRRDLAWRSANLENFRLRRSFARGPAPSTPVLKRIDDFGGGARENKKKVS